MQYTVHKLAFCVIGILVHSCMLYLVSSLLCITLQCCCVVTLCVLQWVYHWHVIMSQEHAANVQSLSSHVTTLYFKTWEFPSSRKSVHVMFVCIDSPHHPHILYHILSTHMLHYSVRSTWSTPYRIAMTHTIYRLTAKDTHFTHKHT